MPLASHYAHGLLSEYLEAMVHLVLLLLTHTEFHSERSRTPTK